MVDLAGSEITSLEVAQTLAGKGYDVTLTATEIGDPWHSQVPPEVRVRYIDEIPEQAQYDLLWIHHGLFAYRLLAGKRIHAANAVFSSLSPFEPLEAPPVTQLSFSHYLVNSVENLAHFSRHYPDLSENVSIFPNACPASYFDAFQADGTYRPLRSVLFVSNHLPPELQELKMLLSERGIEAKHVGIGGEVTRVTPSLVSAFDAVVTIGKTVQYALGAGTPAFCYDHFGGPGWIMPENFDRALDANFSGRCTRRSEAATSLCLSLVEGFEQAWRQREELRSRAKDLFSLSVNVDEILAKASKRPFANHLSVADSNSLANLCTTFEQQRGIIRALASR